MKVFITRDIPEIAYQLLKKNMINFSVFSEDRPISKKELIDNIKEADAVISLLTEKFSKDVINKMQRCKVIANYAAGYNNIDVDYAKRKGIIITNTPDVLTDSTADLTMALTLACARRLTEGAKMMRKNQFKGWKPKLILGVELRNKKFGVLGAGRIGSAVALRANSFGCKILYYSEFRNRELEIATGAEKVSLKKLLGSSDIVSIHLPLNNKTKHLIDKEKLALFKKTSILINTARGEIIDEKELIVTLKKKKIFAAGLDVFENEPKVNRELFKLDNAVLLPHIGSATVEARNKMAELAAKNVIAVLKGKKPLTPV